MSIDLNRVRMLVSNAIDICEKLNYDNSRNYVRYASQISNMTVDEKTGFAPIDWVSAIFFVPESRWEEVISMADRFEPCTEKYQDMDGLLYECGYLIREGKIDVLILKGVVDDHAVYERLVLSWMNDDVTKGLVSEPSDHDFNESNTRTNDDIYNSYLNELIYASGYKEDISENEINVCYNVDDRYHQAFEYKQLVGRLTVVKQGEIFKLKPNFTTTDQPFTIEVYAPVDCWDSVRLVMPKEMKTHQVEKMFIDFFKLLDFDLQVSPGGVGGGGYTYRSFRMREQAHYRYKDWHIEHGYVVLETA